MIKGFKNKKPAMVMAEVVIALVLCGILMTVSVLTFKSKDVTTTPYIYSIMNKMHDINKHVIEACIADGDCQDRTLPNDKVQYCERLADTLNTSTNIDCKINNSASDIVNFKVSNGVTFLNLTKKADWEDLDGTQRQYIDALISTAKNNDRRVGINTFPVRIFKNGEIIPSSDIGYSAFDDEDYFSYRVILNKAADKLNPNIREKIILNANENDDTKPYREKVSFREAICILSPAQNIATYLGDEAKCTNLEVLNSCNSYPKFEDGTEDISAFCTIEPIKPKGSGLFRIFGI